MVLIASVAAKKGNIELYERKKIIMIMMSIKSKNESIAMVIATAMRFGKKMLICLIFCFFFCIFGSVYPFELLFHIYLSCFFFRYFLSRRV